MATSPPPTYTLTAEADPVPVKLDAVTPVRTFAVLVQGSGAAFDATKNVQGMGRATLTVPHGAAREATVSLAFDLDPPGGPEVEDSVGQLAEADLVFHADGTLELPTGCPMGTEVGNPACEIRYFVSVRLNGEAESAFGELLCAADLFDPTSEVQSDGAELRVTVTEVEPRP